MKDLLQSETIKNQAQTITALENTEALKSLANHLQESTRNVEEYVCDGSRAIVDGMDQMSSSSKRAAAGITMISEHSRTMATGVQSVTREIHGVRIVAGSLVDKIDYYGRFFQGAAVTFAIQIYQGVEALKVIGQKLDDISKELLDRNSLLVQGSQCEDGFAKHVYQYVKMRIDENGGGEHRFFVFHPDTNWYPSFHTMIRSNPLPATFCAKSDNLDQLCRFMLQHREDVGPDVTFHLLIPAWSPVTITEPLHFPEGLGSLSVEGLSHKGRAYVSLNLPAAPVGLLHGVANVVDPTGANGTAALVAGAVTLPTVGWGINGACLAFGVGVASLTPLGPLLAIPIWCGTAVPAMMAAAPAIQSTIYESLREDRARILGSHLRLPRMM